MSFLGKLNPLKIAKAALSPVLAMDHVLRKVPAYKKVSQLAPMSKERDQALKAAHAVMGSAHSLVKRAATGDLHAKQAISSAIDAAAKGDPRAQAAVHALTAARLQQKLDPDLAFLTKRSAFLPARAASAGHWGPMDPDFLQARLNTIREAYNAERQRMNAGELAIVGANKLTLTAADIAWAKSMLPRVRAMLADLQRARQGLGNPQQPSAELQRIDALIDKARVWLAVLERCVSTLKPFAMASAGGLPRMSAVELVTAGCGGEWLSTAGGDVFVPIAYRGTAGARVARRQTLLMTPAIRAQLKTAAVKERAGQLPLGTTRRWAERAVSGFESAHGGAQTLREWLGQEPSLNIALK